MHVLNYSIRKFVYIEPRECIGMDGIIQNSQTAKKAFCGPQKKHSEKQMRSKVVHEH